jgi:hypothetical protein
LPEQVLFGGVRGAGEGALVGLTRFRRRGDLSAGRALTIMGGGWRTHIMRALEAELADRE